MASNAENYYKYSTYPILNGMDLIDCFINRNNIKFCDIIVDIGCGTGNMTKILSNKIPHKQILAFDISSEMTEIAKKNFSSDSIDYLTEDIGKPWDQLNPELKALESKVSLIFSNQVLNLVEDKETAVKNISKLLKVNGNICVNIFKPLDVTPYLRPDLQQMFVKIPNNEDYYMIWKKYFTNNGIVLSYSHINQFEVNRKSELIEENFQCGFQFIWMYYKLYLKSKLPEQVIDMLRAEIYKAGLNLRLKADDEEYKSDTSQKFLESGKKSFYNKVIELTFIGIQSGQNKN